MMPAMRPYGAVWRRKSGGAVAVCVHDAQGGFYRGGDEGKGQAESSGGATNGSRRLTR
jgi:hypothetical protein